MRILWFLVGALVACGAPPLPSAPARLDVLHHVYLRGSPGDLVGLSFDGLGPCAGEVLARLSPPGAPGALRATFFVDPVEAPDPAVLARLEAEGHEVALRIDHVPSGWSQPTALRVGLIEAAEALTERLSAGGYARPLPRFWRPGGTPDPLTLGRAADAERPLVFWSVYGEGPDLQGILPRVTGGELLALPTSGPGCPVVPWVPELQRVLVERRLRAVPVSELLGPLVARHDPARVVRYRGPGLTATCAQALGRAPEPDAEVEGPRWGLVQRTRSDAVLVVPLGAAASTAEVLANEVGLLWTDRPRWQSLPACRQWVPNGRLLSPLVGTGRWWVVGEEGLSERTTDAVGPPGEVVRLPGLFDLLRLEARRRLSWGLRGVVAEVLVNLGLEAPLLLEARVVPAVVVGRPLAPGASLAEVESAVAAFTQVVELSLGEYLFLAMQSPAELATLQQAARAADGFLRPGPFLVLRQGGLPDGRRMGPDGAGFAHDPTHLLAQVLATGVPLAPGDVVTPHPAPLRGAPMAGAADPKLSRRARLRHGLGRSMLAAMRDPGYLRPGAVLRVEGDLLGAQVVRVVVPPGVGAPSPDAWPLKPAGSPGEAR